MVAKPTLDGEPFADRQQQGVRDYIFQGYWKTEKKREEQTTANNSIESSETVSRPVSVEFAYFWGKLGEEMGVARGRGESCRDDLLFPQGNHPSLTPSKFP